MRAASTATRCTPSGESSWVHVLVFMWQNLLSLFLFWLVMKLMCCKHASNNSVRICREDFLTNTSGKIHHELRTSIVSVYLGKFSRHIRHWFFACSKKMSANMPAMIPYVYFGNTSWKIRLKNSSWTKNIVRLSLRREVLPTHTTLILCMFWKDVCQENWAAKYSDASKVFGLENYDNTCAVFSFRHFTAISCVFLWFTTVYIETKRLCSQAEKPSDESVISLPLSYMTKRSGKVKFGEGGPKVFLLQPIDANKEASTHENRNHDKERISALRCHGFLGIWHTRHLVSQPDNRDVLFQYKQ